MVFYPIIIIHIKLYKKIHYQMLGAIIRHIIFLRGDAYLNFRNYIFNRVIIYN